VPYRLKQLASEIGAELHGDPEGEVRSFAPLAGAQAGSISFLSGSRYRKFLKDTRATAVILAKEDLAACPTSALVCRDPYLAFAKVARLLSPEPAAPAAGIHASAVVDVTASVHPLASVGPHCVIEAGAILEEGAVLGPFCLVGRESSVGAYTRLVASVTLCARVRIGSRSLVHPGVVIGADGFGFANDAGRWLKIPQIGGVLIGNDVEIGANTTIDRGALEDTVIEDGVKLDNLVQIAHNVKIGAHTAVAGCVGISGSTKIGKHCAIGGASGIGGHLEITDGVIIGGMSRLNKSITRAGEYVSGTPVDTMHQWRKNSARFKHLDEMARRLAALEKKVGQP
jgi:UDP-3-O-[3-hydroxymyristoyl] glucosamine N-acyltransferase